MLGKTLPYKNLIYLLKSLIYFELFELHSFMRIKIQLFKFEKKNNYIINLKMKKKLFYYSVTII